MGGGTREDHVGTYDGGGCRQEEAQTAADTVMLGGRGPPGVSKAGGDRTHREMQCCLPQYRWDHTRQRPEVHNRQQKNCHSDQIWSEIFVNCGTDGQG